MDQQNQPSDPNDEQTVIAAMRLLARNLQSSQREKMFAILAREQEEYTQITPLERQSDDAPEAEQLVYPVQPLMLGSEDGHSASSESTSDTVTDESNADIPHEMHEDIGTERRYDERIPFAPLLLPFAASFSPRQWLGRFLACVMFLFALSVSTLLAYNAGLEARTVTNTPVAHSSVSGCMQDYIVIRGHMSYFRNPEGPVQVGETVNIVNESDESGTFVSVIHRNDFQCGRFYGRGFDRHFPH